jgi:SPP1 family predicted phage head-tail adaptor
VRWSDVVDLVGIVEGTDEYGFPTEEIVIRQNIFANKKSVRSNEFYLAKQSGIELQYMFEIRSIDYQGEEKIVYNGEEYRVERTYDKGEVIELVCSRKADDHEA